MNKTTKQVAVITGASKGIGRTVALDLAKQGYMVALLARSADKLKNVAKDIEKNGGASDIYTIDVSNYNNVDKTINAIVAKYKHIDLLFNNAGVLYPGSDDLTVAEINEIVDVNLKGAIYVANKVVPIMKKQKSGYIINVSSRAGIEGFSGISAYCASKFGLRGYSESLFNELLQYGIKVTALCPCFVNTDMPSWVEASKKKLMIPQEEIVRAVNYLLQLDRRAAIKELVVYCTDCLCGKIV